MLVKILELQNFRNYQNEKIEFDPAINIFIGLNAQGKTNILEAIFMTATSRSNRVQRNTELIKFEAGPADKAHINLWSSNAQGDNYIHIEIMNDGNKTVYINGKRIKKATDLLGYFNVVFFSPEDLDLVNGPPADRRRLIDIFISQVKPLYAVTVNDYQKVVQQRNETLKQISQGKTAEAMLDIWDEQLVSLADRIVADRIEAIISIARNASSFYTQVCKSDEKVDIKYYTDVINKAQGEITNYKRVLAQKLSETRKRDIYTGNTSCGPHRDDILLGINGKDARQFASQGQKRLISLSLKYAEVEYIREKSGEYPVLLFDDVLLELDLRRKHNLLQELLQKTQIIITTTDLKRYQEAIIDKARIFRVKHGTISKGENDES